jgi:hypothetical protein
MGFLKMGVTAKEYRNLIGEGAKKKSKYGNKPTIACDGTRCPSRKHAIYHNGLVLAKKCGLLKFFLREVPFDLADGIKHRVDYLEFWHNGNIKFVEVKGKDLPLGKLKRKQVEELYGIAVEVV